MSLYPDRCQKPVCRADLVKNVAGSRFTYTSFMIYPAPAPSNQILPLESNYPQLQRANGRLLLQHLASPFHSTVYL
jgi:hypothetical protein